MVERVHGILLAGGSAWGLDAAGGVMRWLDEHGIGHPGGPGRVPIVPGAVLFDLALGDPRIRPTPPPATRLPSGFAPSPGRGQRRGPAPAR